VVDPNEHFRVGSMQYPETLPLNDHEVVLTFDDGPLPRYTSRILETLASNMDRRTDLEADNLLRCYAWARWLPVTLLIRAGQYVPPHCLLDLRFRRAF
jgi:hypothetical protein